MKRRDVKSNCPINFTIEIFGDPWSLLIYREMTASGRTRFGELLEMEERIGSSVLAEKLTHLENKGIVRKERDLEDGRKTIYKLTHIGISALPLFYEIAVWGSRTSPNPKASDSWFKAVDLDRQLLLNAWRSALESDSSFFTGNNSVVRQLNI
jgi:DNA-binding HxlR family transcriptional regulator